MQVTLPDESQKGLRPLDKAYATLLDENDPVRECRKEFRIPQRGTLKKSVKDSGAEDDPCTYFCGHGIGLQPRRLPDFVRNHLELWATQGPFAGLRQVPDSPAMPWAKVEVETARQMADLVGAEPAEVSLLGGSTTSLHLLMASFYRPEGRKRKIIVEKTAFSSDFYAVESQIRWHGLDVGENMVLIESDPLIPTTRVLEAIDTNAADTAMLLLSGVQFLTGQLLDVPTITAHARSKGILVCWDMAHAAGNVELRLHDWDVDLAVWCTYKYLNCGPGCVGAAFVHAKHGTVDTARGVDGYRPRLAGWWGNRPEERFKMENTFRPAAGAAGFQVSNPSILELTSVLASLSVFAQAGMPALRRKSVLLTGYLEHLLVNTEFGAVRSTASGQNASQQRPFEIITPADPEARGAQLSLRMDASILDNVLAELEQRGMIVDVRKPNIMRVTPVPLYNTFTEVWHFVDALKEVLGKVGS